MGQSLESLITGTASRIFWALPWPVFGVHTTHGQRHTVLRAKRPAVPLKIISRRLQAVVNVNSAHLSRPLLGTRHKESG